MDETQKPSNSSPQLRAGFLSRLFFCWLNDLFKLGNKRPLEVSDVYDVLQEDSSKVLCDELERNWNKEVSSARTSGDKRKPRLRRALFKTFGLEYAIWGIVILLEEAMKIVQAVLLGGLIRYTSRNSDMKQWEAFLYAAGIGLCSIIPAITHHPYFLTVFRFGMRMRIACCSLIYRKALVLNSTAMRKATVGHMVNLMSNDVFRLDLSAIFLHYFILTPMEIVAVVIILWQYISWSALTGMISLLLLLPVQGVFGRVFARLRGQTATLTDERLRLINELLCSIKIVKMYCWETFFKNLISETRRQEVKRILKASYVRALMFTPIFTSSKVVAYVTFLTFVLLGNELTAEIVFVSLSLFGPVRFAMTFAIPFAIQFGSEATVTIDRLEEFLLLEERKSHKLPNEGESKVLPSVSVSGLSAAWDQETGQKILDNVSFDVQQGELLTVIGPVGAGKSSLLLALLNELPLVNGDVKVDGRIAYAAQQAWVFAASVRQNIVFGKPFDADRYGRVIKAAALEKDLEIMPDGDKTLIGERGVSLSGGQKARISLARALYGDADIYLLDDPLSAVDIHVGRHIFKHCICGFLKKKVCILVTHHIQYLKAASKILVLGGDGRGRTGTFEELSKGGVDFESLIKSIEEEKAKVDSDIVLDEDNNADHETEMLVKKTPSQQKLTLSQTSLNRRKTVQNGFATSTTSLASQTSVAGGNYDAEFVAVVQPEEVRAGGRVTAGLYFRFFYYGAGVFGLIIYALLNILAQVSFVLADWWLAYWCNSLADHKRRLEELIAMANSTVGNFSKMADGNVTSFSTPMPFDESTDGSIVLTPFDNIFYLHIFTVLTVAVLFFGILRAVQSFHILVSSAVVLHKMMLASILRSSMSFFNTNPVGRVLNRFSKDLGQVEETLPFFMYDFIMASLLVIAIILVVGIVNPWVFIPVIPLCALFLYIRHYYLNTGRCLKRIEAVTKSPVFSHISSTVLGLQTIRAYRAEETFTREFDSHQDLHTSAVYLFFMTSRWFAVRLEWLCAIFITFVAFISVFSAQHLSGGLVGLSLNYVISLMALFQWAVRQSTEVESMMTSVERLVEYSELTDEAALETNKQEKLADEWPVKTDITATNVSLQYASDGPVVLKDLNFTIRDREKIGIVGRTGAGKSSLITMFFRLAEPSGQLCIDGRDIKTIPLRQLRTKISIIPQEPVLLKGTLRMNLDPLELYSDLQIWHALEQVQLKSTFKETGAELNYEINEGGSNISVGESQLVCLARAILKCNRLLIIDEATANVDPRTDSLIQKTIREQFRHCTVLTIAHRLNTIIDSDRIMVLDEGRLVEFDHPYKLLTDSNSVFYNMAQRAGAEEFNSLLKQASLSQTAGHWYAMGQISAGVLSSFQLDRWFESIESTS